MSGLATINAPIALLFAILNTGWGQPPPAGSVLFPTDRGLVGYGIARNATIAKQRALEDASANRWISVRFETFMQGMGYAYSFDEFAIEDPAGADKVTVIDSTRREDRLVLLMVAYPDSTSAMAPSDDVWEMSGAYRAVNGEEYRSYVLAKRQAIRSIVEAKFKSVKVMDEATAEKMARFAYISTKAIVRNIRVLEVAHRSDSTVVRIAIRPEDVFFYE